MNKTASHTISVQTYLIVGGLLLLLTGLTVLISFVDLGGMNVVIALIIASTKALLVALFFMHLLHDHKLYLIIFSTAIIFLAIFLMLTMFDVMTRGEINALEKKPINPNAMIYNQTASSSKNSQAR
jgi:cytochrome c oxidase subunit 4